MRGASSRTQSTRSAGSAPTGGPRCCLRVLSAAGLIEHRSANEDDISVASGFLSVTVRPWLVMMRGA